MKLCELCTEEISTRDGDNRCHKCSELETRKAEQNAQRNSARRAREAALRSCGLVKVRGALGGTYWE